MEVSNRQDVISEFKLLAIPFTCALIVIAIAIGLSEQKIEFSGFILILGAFFLLAYFQQKTRNIKANIKSLMVEGVCGYLGWTYFAEVTDRPDLKMLADFGLIRSTFERASFEDQISGAVHGADFRSVEAHLERKNDDSWATVFRGQIMTLTFPRKFLGQTVVLRDKGMFQSKKRGDMKRVGLVDPVFEKIFEAYSTDQVESRYLLDPVFMQKLVDLERSVDGKRIRFGFIEGQLLIVVETKNRYEAGSMLKSLTAHERTQKILDEIGAIYDIVDAVLAPSAS